MDAEVLKVEVEVEACAVCGTAAEELHAPEEHDAGAAPSQPPLRAMLLHLNHTKMIPSGKLCMSCIRKTMEAYSFSTMLAAKGPPPLSEKIRALRKRLHELTQKIDVFIVVGCGGADGAYSEDDIIMVERAALAAAARADAAELLRARSLRGDHVYQCTVCPQTFQRSAEYRAHAAAHGATPPGAAPRHSCWTCGAQFTSHAAAATHAATHGLPATLVCHLCDRTFQSQAERRRHEAGCAARCPVCGLECESRAALRAHAGAHAGLCGSCFLQLPSAAALQAHALAHRQARQFVCGYDGCILRFACRSDLLAHIRKCHAGELEPAPEPALQSAPAAGPVACAHCDRTFATAAAMKRHARVHRAAPHAQEDAEWATTDGEERVEYLEMEALEEMDAD